MNCELYGAECVLLPDTPRVPKRRRHVNISIPDGHASSSHLVAPDDASTESTDGPAASGGNIISSPKNTNGAGAGVGDADEDAGRYPGADGGADPKNNNSKNISPRTDLLPAAPLDLFASTERPNIHPVFEQAISDGTIDLVHEFWELDSFIANCNPPDEHAAAEQLMAIHSPPETEPLPDSRTPSASSHPDAQGSVGKLFGVERLAAQSTNNRGSLSSGIFHGKGKGNSGFFGLSTISFLAVCLVLRWPLCRIHLRCGNRCTMHSRIEGRTTSTGRFRVPGLYS